MTVNVRYHGAIKKALPAAHRGTHKVHATTYLELLTYTDQLFPMREFIKRNSFDVKIGSTLSEARALKADQVARWKIPAGSTVHFVPNTNGAITGAILISALVTAAISIAVTLAVNLLFPASTTKTDNRKSALYQNGLNSNKEGVCLPYLAGDRVFCGGNIIEGDYDYTNSGGAAPYSYLGGYGGTLSDGFLLTQQLESFKGKGGGKTISNSAYSDATIRFAMAYGAGEVGGIVGSNYLEKSKNILINELPLIDHSTGQANWSGVYWEERFGVEGQEPLKITPGTSSTFNSGVELTHDAGNGGGQLYINEIVSDADVDSVKLDIRINQLVSTDSKGNQSKTGVDFGADVKRVFSGNWVNAGHWTVYEKSSTTFDRQYLIAAPSKQLGQESDPWQFRVYRSTPDSTDDKLTNGTTFKGWVETKNKDYRYDGTEIAGAVPTALFAAAIDLAPFGQDSKPEVALIVQGQKVRVPDNYDTSSRTYSGIWSGAWKYAVTANPVWHWLEIATAPGMGCGFPLSFFDKFDLYQTAKRCDERINGRFRYSINKQFMDEQEGWAALVDLAQTFRAVPFFDGTQLRLAQDRPGTPDYFINNSHVENGLFSYKSTPGEQQYNEIIVQWDNPDDYYRVASVKARDEDSIARNRAHNISNNGIVTKTVYKTGCTDRQEAYDFARAMVFDAQNQNTTITFNTSINACAYIPGGRILIDDWQITGKQPVGRVINVTSGQMTVDAPTIQKPNTSYDALLTVNNVLSRRPIIQIASASNTTVFNLDTTDLQPLTPVSIVDNSAEGVQPLEYKITDIQETESGKFQITALRYVEGKHAYLDSGTPVAYTPWSQVQVVTPVPTGLKFSPSSYMDDLLGARHGIDISWDAINANPTGTNQGIALAGYVLEVQRPNSSTWEQVYKGVDNFATLLNAEYGSYSFSLRSLSIVGKSSNAEVASYQLASSETGSVLPPVFTGFK